jgi:hypothetical protein
MADNLLDLIGGFVYQPFTAEGAMLDPAAELGDGINVNGVPSGIYRRDTKFNSNCASNISAPYDEEVNYAFPYESKQYREIKRKTKQISSELTIQADQIAAKVSKTGGDASSFGWVLDEKSWTISAGATTVLQATKDGLEVKGKITATSGTIGGFTINSNHISYNGQTWAGTEETTGIYIGVSGIRLGKNFTVDSAGNLKAYSGTFEGSVTAGNILYGKTEDGKKNYGTLNGSALTSNTVSGNRLKLNTVSTAYTSAGINSSLGFADFANGVFNGFNTANSLTCNNFTVNAKEIYMKGYKVRLASRLIDGEWTNYLTWDSLEDMTTAMEE